MLTPIQTTKSKPSELFYNEAPELGTGAPPPNFFINFKRRFSQGTPIPAINNKILRSYPSLNGLLQKNHHHQSPELNLTKTTPKLRSRKGSVASLCSTCSFSSEVSRNHIASPEPSFDEMIPFQLGYEIRKDHSHHQFDKMVNSGYGQTSHGRMYTLQLTLTPELVREDQEE